MGQSFLDGGIQVGGKQARGCGIGFFGLRDTSRRETGEGMWDRVLMDRGIQVGGRQERRVWDRVLMDRGIQVGGRQERGMWDRVFWMEGDK